MCYAGLPGKSLRNLEIKHLGLGFLRLDSSIASPGLGFFGSDSWVWTPSQTFMKTLSKPMRFEPKSQILTRYSRSDPVGMREGGPGTPFLFTSPS